MESSLSESTYGSDKAGLVCAYVFAPHQPGRPIGSEEASERLAQPDAPSEFLWLHFSLSNAASERWLTSYMTLPEAFYESLQATSSTRVEVVDDALLATINDVHFFDFEASRASRVTLFANRRVLISARTTALRAIDRLRVSVNRGELFRSPAELLAHLLRDQAEVLVEIVRNATSEVDALEDRILQNQTTSRPKLGTLRRTLVRLQRLLAPEPAALFRLLNRPPSWISEADLSDLRQSAEELSAAVTDSVALAERVRLIQEELMAMLNERTGRTLFILTVVTVLALPMTIIPGLFGMNVGGVPLSHHPMGFWMVLILVVMIVGAGTAVVARRP